MSKWGWWFAVNKENINKNWRPIRQVFMKQIKKLEDMGYREVTNDEMTKNSLILMWMQQDDLVKIAKDKTREMYVRIIAKELLSARWFDVIYKILERAFWTKAQIDINTNLANNVVFILPDNWRDKDIKWQIQNQWQMLEQ